MAQAYGLGSKSSILRYIQNGEKTKKEMEEHTIEWLKEKMVKKERIYFSSHGIVCSKHHGMFARYALVLVMYHIDVKVVNVSIDNVLLTVFAKPFDYSLRSDLDIDLCSDCSALTQCHRYSNVEICAKPCLPHTFSIRRNSIVMLSGLWSARNVEYPPSSSSEIEDVDQLKTLISSRRDRIVYLHHALHTTSGEQCVLVVCHIQNVYRW
ncbi:hypothetical protein MRB53_042345 [Persea americana]|nr:hypothetical protein MRB53_042345 [Persea americana]